MTTAVRQAFAEAVAWFVTSAAAAKGRWDAPTEVTGRTALPPAFSVV